MAVPISVDDIREQAKEAIKLSLLDSGDVVNVLGLFTDWNKFNDETEYPVAKVLAGRSVTSSKYMGKSDMNTDVVKVVIAPYCTESDVELKCSKIITGTRTAFGTERIRSFMDSSYRMYLGEVNRIEANPLDTDLVNPKGMVEITLSITYRVNW
jgi:hypothetical protein